jgi:hypothetical protein
MCAVERVTGKVVAESGELQDEEQFLRERQQQLERDLNELKRRQEAVRLEKLERQLQVRSLTPLSWVLLITRFLLCCCGERLVTWWLRCALQMEAERTLQSIQDELQVELQSRSAQEREREGGRRRQRQRNGERNIGREGERGVGREGGVCVCVCEFQAELQSTVEVCAAPVVVLHCLSTPGRIGRAISFRLRASFVFGQDKGAAGREGTQHDRVPSVPS